MWVLAVKMEIPNPHTKVTQSNWLIYLPAQTGSSTISKTDESLGHFLN